MMKVTGTVLGGLLLWTLSFGNAMPVGAVVPDSATVTVVKENTDPDLFRLVYTAGASEANQVMIAVDAWRSTSLPRWVVRETGRNTVTQQPIELIAGPGCTRVDSQTASCGYASTLAGLTVDVQLGDESDIASLAAACHKPDEDHGCDAVVRGGEGNDVLSGNHVNGVQRGRLYGDEGDDRLEAGAHGSMLDGGLGNDRLFGEHEADILFGRDGRDQLVGGSGEDQVVGGRGRDHIEGRDGADTIDAGPDRDFVDGENGRDRIAGGSGNDVLWGGPGNDGLRGGDGDDTFYARDGMRDVVRGGSGTDRARLDRGDEISSIEARF